MCYYLLMTWEVLPRVYLKCSNINNCQSIAIWSVYAVQGSSGCDSWHNQLYFNEKIILFLNIVPVYTHCSNITECKCEKRFTANRKKQFPCPRDKCSAKLCSVRYSYELMTHFWQEVPRTSSFITNFCRENTTIGPIQLPPTDLFWCSSSSPHQLLSKRPGATFPVSLQV